MDQTPTVPATPPSPLAPDKPTESRHSRFHTFSPFRLIIGLIVILFGLQLLAANYGWSWAASFDVWKLWPVFIILIGLSMFVRGGRGSGVISGIIGIILVIIIAAFFTLRVTPGSGTTSQGGFDAVMSEGTTTANVSVDFGASKITVGGGATALLDGSYESTFGPIVLDQATDGTVQHETIHQDQSSGWWFGSHRTTLDVHLSDTVPMDVTFNTGAADLTADLTSVLTNNVTVKAGAATVKLILGDKAPQSTVHIQAGASTIHVTVPKTAGVKLQLDAGASSKHLTDFIEKSNHTYESATYVSQEKKIDLTIDAGASTITVDWQ